MLTRHAGGGPCAGTGGSNMLTLHTGLADHSLLRPLSLKMAVQLAGLANHSFGAQGDGPHEHMGSGGVQGGSASGVWTGPYDVTTVGSCTLRNSCGALWFS